MRDIYGTLGSPAVLVMGNRTETPGCVVEEAVNGALCKSFEDAESLLLARLGEVTLAALSEDVRRRLATRRRAGHSGKGHTRGSERGARPLEHEPVGPHESHRSRP